MKIFRRGVWENLVRLTGIVFVLGGLLVLPVSAQEVLPSLFSEADPFAPQMDLPADYSGEVIRARWTQVDFGVVAQMARSGPRQDGDEQPDFAFNLFPDVSYPAYIQGVEEMLNGAVGIYGRVSDGAVSEFVLVVNSGLMHAYLQDDVDTYEVRYQNGGHLIVEVDSSRYPDSLPPVPAPQTEMGAGAAIQADPLPQADTADYIDVLGVYTPAARDAVPYATIGETDVELRIQASILSANLGYENSGVTQRLRLVGMEEVDYTEIISGQTDASMWSFALYRLAFGYYNAGGDSPSANYLSDARYFRDAYGADLVFMLTDLPYSFCGMGFLGGDPGDEAVGYSIEHWYCSGSTSYTVQHELGHNMGACHDWANTDDYIKNNFCFDINYSFGYQQPAGPFYSVMAYACDGCYRINVWSTPNVLVNGLNIGTVNDDNVRTLNTTDINVANYRQSIQVQANFTPAGSYQTLGYRTTVLDLETSSPFGSIVQVTYEAYFNGSWHTLSTDTNPADGWAYTWNTFPLRGQLVSIRAVAEDVLGNEGVTQINNVLVDYGLTIGEEEEFTARGGGREDLNQPTMGLADMPAAVFLNPIPVDEAALADFTAQFEPARRVLHGKMPPIRMY